MNVISVLEQFAHHNPATSPDNMVNYIKYDLVIKPSSPDKTQTIIGKIRNKINDDIKKLTGMTGYEIPSLISELKIFNNTFMGENLVHFFNGDINCKIFPFIKGKNTVITTYHQPPDFFYNFFKKCSHINKLDGILVTSNIQIDLFSKYISKDKIFFSPLAVDINLFKPTFKKKENNQKRICLFVGNWLRDFKTMCEIIEFLDKHKNIEFHIITLEMNRKYFNDFNNVRFYSGIPLDHYLHELDIADLLVVPLKSCTSNLAILESMASGLPIITTDVGGIRDYVDESFAILHKKGNFKAMAESIVDLLGDDMKMEEMSKNSRKHSEKYSWEVISENLKSIYQKFGAINI